MFAFTQVLFAGLLLPAEPLVVLVSVPPPVGMSEVAETTVVPVTLDVITTLQVALVAPPE